MPGTDAEAAVFIRRLAPSEASERGNYQTFLSELCDLLKVPRPDPAVADDTAHHDQLPQRRLHPLTATGTP